MVPPCISIGWMVRSLTGESICKLVVGSIMSWCKKGNWTAMNCHWANVLQVWRCLKRPQDRVVMIHLGDLGDRVAKDSRVCYPKRRKNERFASNLTPIVVSNNAQNRYISAWRTAAILWTNPSGSSNPWRNTVIIEEHLQDWFPFRIKLRSLFWLCYPPKPALVFIFFQPVSTVHTHYTSDSWELQLRPVHEFHSLLHWFLGVFGTEYHQRLTSHKSHPLWVAAWVRWRFWRSHPWNRCPAYVRHNGILAPRGPSLAPLPLPAFSPVPDPRLAGNRRWPWPPRPGCLSSPRSRTSAGWHLFANLLLSWKSPGNLWKLRLGRFPPRWPRCVGDN